MSDQSLRDALEALAADRESPNGAAPSDYVIEPYEIRELLAAHPVEPAPVVTDEVRKAARDAALFRWGTGSADTTQMLLAVDAALEAAAPLLGPRPMPTREQLFQYLHEVTGCICDLTEDSDWARGHRQVWYERTDKLLALLNGSEA